MQEVDSTHFKRKQSVSFIKFLGLLAYLFKKNLE